MDFLSNIEADIAMSHQLRSDAPKAGVHKISMDSRPYGSHSYTHNTLSGFSYQSSYDMPDSYLRLIRKLSRQLIFTGTVGPAILSARTVPVVGDGITIKPSIDKTLSGLSDEEIKDKNSRLKSYLKYYLANAFKSSDNISGLTVDLYKIMTSVYADGDCWISIQYSKKREKEYGFGTYWQVIPGSRVINPGSNPNSDKIRNGVEYEGNEAIAIHVAVASVDNPEGYKTERIALYTKGGVRKVHQVSFPGRSEPGQLRPLPLMAPVIDDVNLLQKFRTAYVTKATLQSKIMLALYDMRIDDGGIENYRDPSSPVKTQVMEDGTAIHIPAGADLKVVDNKAPSTGYKEYSTDGVGAEVAAACDVPPEVMSKKYSTSFTAASAARSDFYKRVKLDRGCINSALKFLYGFFVSEAIQKGYIYAPGFVSDKFVNFAYKEASFSGPPMGSLNILMDAKARALMEEKCWIPKRTNAAELGYDLDTDEESTMSGAELQRLYNETLISKEGKEL
jgi:hypothetical protein